MIKPGFSSMLVASFSGLYCFITHLHVYQCQPLMNILQQLFRLSDSAHRASLLYLCIGKLQLRLLPIHITHLYDVYSGSIMVPYKRRERDSIHRSIKLVNVYLNLTHANDLSHRDWRQKIKVILASKQDVLGIICK